MRYLIQPIPVLAASVFLGLRLAPIKSRCVGVEVPTQELLSDHPNNMRYQQTIPPNPASLKLRDILYDLLTCLFGIRPLTLPAYFISLKK